jgi:hypothetical protein
MAWHIYSTEALPNPDFQGKPGYTPDGLYIKWGGIALPPVPKQKWVKLEDTYPSLRRRDWTDKRGEEIEIPIRRFKPIVDGRFAEMGVILLDHEPSEIEKKTLEATSANLNLNWRKRQIEFFEQQREVAIARQGTYPVTPYIDECYDILDIKKPYSVESLEAKRDPGAKAAAMIAKAIKEALSQTHKEGIDQAVEILTRPQPEEVKVPAARR